MYVKCEKCGTEYEFDDRKVAASGITVKCTNCDHLFRVARTPASAPVPEREREDPSYEVPRPTRTRWMIRNGSGQIREFKDLATLHQWIAQGKVSQSDEISKTGENWKPLSAIVELSALFTQTGVRAIPRSAPPGQAPPIASPGTLPGIVASAPPRAIETSGVHRRPTHGGPSAEVVGGPAAPPEAPRLPASGPGSTVLGMRVTPPPIQRGSGAPGRGAALNFDDTVRTPPPKAMQQDREPSPAPAGTPPRRDGGEPARMTGGLSAVRLPDQFEPSMGSAMTPLPAPAQLQTMGFGTASPAGGQQAGAATPPPLPRVRTTPGVGLAGGVPGADPRSTGMHGVAPGAFGSAASVPGSAVRSTGMHPAISGEGSTLGFSFDGEQPPLGARPAGGSGGGRGFATGVLASVALAGAGYFVYDMFLRNKPGSADSAPSATSAGGVDSSLLVRLDRAEDRYASDGTEGFAEAERLGQQVMLGLGEPPADARLATRARLVVAQSAIARAEYARLDGESPEGAAAALASAERYLAEARALSPEDGAVDLTYADLRRVQGDMAGARGALARARDHGAPSGTLALVEAALLLHTRTDDVALADRMAALPPSVLELPRARYLLAVAQQRAGRLDAAHQTLRALIADRREHGPALRLLAAVGERAARTHGGEVQRPGTLASAGVAVDPAATSAPAAPGLRAVPLAPASEASGVAAAVVAPRSTALAPAENPAAGLGSAGTTVAVVEQIKAVPDVVLGSVAPGDARPATPSPSPAPAVAAGPTSESFDSLLRRGHRLLEQGKTVQARRLFLQAIEINGRSAEALANLAWCDLDDGQHSAAIRNFGRALERNSRYADALYGLAMAHDSAGHAADARRAYQEYLDQHPGGRQAAMVRRKLEALK